MDFKVRVKESLWDEACLTQKRRLLEQDTVGIIRGFERGVDLINEKNP